MVTTTPRYIELALLDLLPNTSRLIPLELACKYLDPSHLC